MSAKRVARWNGSSWAALGSGMSGGVRALAVHDDGGGPALYAGGEFLLAYDSRDSYMAKWSYPALDLDPRLSDSAKYRCLGNAVARPVSEWIGRRILEAARTEPMAQTL